MQSDGELGLYRSFQDLEMDPLVISSICAAPQRRIVQTSLHLGCS